MDGIMAFLIGADEAGYGPNLGPLVISATVWEVPDHISHPDLYGILDNCITDARDESDRVWMADSKQLYKPGGGLAALELGVLASLAATGQSFIDGWKHLFETLAADQRKDMGQLPWYAEFDESLPIDASGEQIDAASLQLIKGLREHGVRIAHIASRAIFPRTFNESLREFENKSAVLSHETIGLISNLIESLHGNVSVLCDKHGGRNKYAGLLQHHFNDGFITVESEGRQSSSYQWKSGEQLVDFEFQAKADHVLTAALASMTSKYIRELAMRAFNLFWCQKKTDLKPTAGYPMDARRFKKQIARVQAGLGISDQVMWRKK